MIHSVDAFSGEDASPRAVNMERFDDTKNALFFRTWV